MAVRRNVLNVKQTDDIQKFLEDAYKIYQGCDGQNEQDTIEQLERNFIKIISPTINYFGTTVATSTTTCTTTTSGNIQSEHNYSGTTVTTSTTTTTTTSIGV